MAIIWCCIRCIVLIILVDSPVLSVASNDSDGSSPNVVKVGVYDNYPKVFEDPSGNYTGIFPDILSTIAKDAGWTLQFIFGSWTQCLQWLETGQIDIMVDVAYSRERAKRFVFSDESTLTNWGTVYTSDDLDVGSLTDLQNLRVAVMQGSIHTTGEQGIKNILKRFNVSPADYIEVDSYEDVFALLDTQQADVGVVNRIFGAMFEREYNVEKTSIIFNPRQLHFAFPKNSPRTPMLKAVVDNSLRSLKRDKDSRYYQALDRYLTMGSTLLDSGLAVQGEQHVALTEEERAWIREHPVIRYAVDPEFVPYEFLAPDGSFNGIASDYVILLSERLGLGFERVPNLTWVQAMSEIEQKKIDVLPCVSANYARKDFLLFSRPYSKFHRVIITQAKAPFITGLNDIASLRVAVQSDSSHVDFLKNNTEIDPIVHETLKEALMSVANGSADAMVGNLAASVYWIRKLNLTNLKIAAPAGQMELDLHFAVRSDWPVLVRIINKGLLSITPEEEQRIMQRWIGLEFKTGIDPLVIKRHIINATIIALLVLAAILLWNYKLKREISRRRDAEDKLRYSNELQKALSQISALFVNLASREIYNGLHSALGSITKALHCQEAYLFKEFSENKLSCVDHWKEDVDTDCASSFLEPTETLAPWRTRDIMTGNVFDVPSVAAMDDAYASAKAYLREHDVGSFLEAPLNYEGAVVGLLGVASRQDGRNWTSEEISFLKLVDQIFTNAFMRNNFEQALQEHALELRQANERLQDFDRLKSMFIASMSHELRTPLNSIIGFTGVVLQGMAGELNKTQKDQLSRVYQASKHLLALITDVIDISKIESGRIDISTQQFQLSEVVDEAVSSVKAHLEKKGLKLHLDMPEDVAMRTDRKRVLQCLINFLNNAVKYTEQGDVTIHVAADQQTVEIKVSDTGIGIDEKDLPRIFVAFERLESHLKIKAGGTGLGLYLTRKLVTELLNGEVIVKSLFGQGSTFGMRIPVDLNAFRKRQITPSEENP